MGLSPSVLVTFACAVLLLSFAAQELVLWAAQRTHGVAGILGVPVVPLIFTRMPASHAIAFAAFGAVQCAALGAIYSALSQRPQSRGAVVVLASTFVGMGFIALAAVASASSDLYAYVGYGVVAGNAYAPQGALPAQFHIIEQMWGSPLTPCVYGPLWLTIDRLTLFGTHALGDAVLRERLLGFVGLLALAAATRFAGAPTGIVAVLVLDPAVWRIWVADAHNDLLGIAGVVTAWAFARRRELYVAVIFIVGAALWKISFGLIGLAALDSRRPARRLGAVAACILLTIALSLGWAGPSYIAAIWHTGRTNAAEGAVGALHLLAGAAVGITILRAAIWRKTMPGATWLMPAIAANLTAWYLIWPLQYAMRARYAATLLVLLPFVGATIGLFSKWLGYGLLLLLIVLAELGPRLAPGFSDLSTPRRSATGEG